MLLDSLPVERIAYTFTDIARSFHLLGRTGVRAQPFQSQFNVIPERGAVATSLLST